MLYLLQTLFLWWLAALALGLVIGFRARGGGGEGGDLQGAVGWALILLAIGATVAVLNVLPGRHGLWLETGLLALAAYGIGCLAGSWLGASAAVAMPLRERDTEARPSVPFQDAPPAPFVFQDAFPATGAMQAPAPASSAAALEPVAEEAISGASPRPGLRPPATDRPETGEDEDNFLLIRGVDPTLSYELHEIGVWRFSQIAAWRQDHLDWIAHEFRQLSPVSARFWPPQARLLAAGALTDYARAVLRGETPPQEVDENTLAAFVADLPRVAPGGAGDGLYAGVRPAGFSEPPLAEKDDLTLVAGIDAEQAARLNGLGVWSWRQIARWSPENARWIGAYLATPGAPERENWVGQARTLVARESHPA